uniref:RNA-directed DNA polymerase n=1 Tax=Zeugodacus cucurbitae TaxID=28588 RepID=A0A0A1WWW7_ZEUCU
MKVSREKTHFFKTSVEHLGFIEPRDGAKTDPAKVKAVQEYPELKDLFSLRSFLGLASYYRCFIKDFASIARPLTEILKGENGLVSKHKSRRVLIDFSEAQRNAFERLRNILASEDVILMYPDFKKPFDLTTDASANGIGAVLSQNGKPITMISRTLKDREMHYATNERELLAIVWALGKLENYLSGTRDIKIYTDHQPLTFAVSDKNPNAKIKRWKAFIDEHNAKIHYKPGKENSVADALSRQNINALESELKSDAATVHSELSLTYTALPALASIQHELVRCFPSTKFWYCKNMVSDITNKDEQREIVTTEHNRAHRAAQENVKHILCDYYFPKMSKLANEIVTNCKICTRAKYDRQPRMQEFGVTPIPSYAGEMLHIDIFSTDKKLFLTCVDKFSKFAVVQPIPSRTITDVKIPILQLINFFPGTKTIYCDNEASFNSDTIVTLLKNQYGIDIVNAPPLYSTSNGQVEKFHSTLVEIARCLKLERRISDTMDLITQATIENNRAIHSVTNKEPIEVIYASTEVFRKEVKGKIEQAQQAQLDRITRQGRRGSLKWGKR